MELLRATDAGRGRSCPGAREVAEPPHMGTQCCPRATAGGRHALPRQRRPRASFACRPQGGRCVAVMALVALTCGAIDCQAWYSHGFVPSYNPMVEAGIVFDGGPRFMLTQKHALGALWPGPLSHPVEALLTGVTFAREYWWQGAGTQREISTLTAGGAIVLSERVCVGATLGFAVGDGISSMLFAPSLYCGLGGYVTPTLRVGCLLGPDSRPILEIVAGVSASITLIVLALQGSGALNGW